MLVQKTLSKGFSISKEKTLVSNNENHKDSVIIGIIYSHDSTVVSVFDTSTGSSTLCLKCLHLNWLNSIRECNTPEICSGSDKISKASVTIAIYLRGGSSRSHVTFYVFNERFYRPCGGSRFPIELLGWYIRQKRRKLHTVIHWYQKFMTQVPSTKVTKNKS